MRLPAEIPAARCHHTCAAGRRVTSTSSSLGEFRRQWTESYPNIISADVDEMKGETQEMPTKPARLSHAELQLDQAIQPAKPILVWTRTRVRSKTRISRRE